MQHMLQLLHIGATIVDNTRCVVYFDKENCKFERCDSFQDQGNGVFCAKKQNLI